MPSSMKHGKIFFHDKMGKIEHSGTKLITKKSINVIQDCHQHKSIVFAKALSKRAFYVCPISWDSLGTFCITYSRYVMIFDTHLFAIIKCYHLLNHFYVLLWSVIDIESNYWPSAWTLSMQKLKTNLNEAVWQKVCRIHYRSAVGQANAWVRLQTSTPDSEI